MLQAFKRLKIREPNPQYLYEHGSRNFKNRIPTCSGTDYIGIKKEDMKIKRDIHNKGASLSFSMLRVRIGGKGNARTRLREMFKREAFL